MTVGTNFIVDKVVQDHFTYDNGHKKIDAVNWYQFRIPITDYQKKVGSIEGFNSIKFMRMFLTDCSDSMILRFAKLNLVRGEWRKYNLTLRQGGETLSTPEEKDATFDISAVNIEQNAGKQPINYVLPPGVSRQTDPSNPQVRMLNEQSMLLKVSDLANGNAKAAYKNVTFDIRQYKRLKMEVHAEQLANNYLQDDELTLFLRIGSDYKDNFYEYEIPLKKTNPTQSRYLDNDADRLLVWPDENRIDIALSDFQLVKQARNNELNRPGTTLSNSSVVFPYVIDGNKGKYNVSGNPN